MGNGCLFLWWTPVPAGRTTGSTASCASSWAEHFHPHFWNSTFGFLSLVPPPRSLSAAVAVFSHYGYIALVLPKSHNLVSSQAPPGPGSPWSRLPSLCVLCSSEGFPDAPFAEGKRRCSRGPATMAERTEAQGMFPSRNTTVINENIAIFQLKCYQYSNLHPSFIPPSLLPDPQVVHHQ